MTRRTDNRGKERYRRATITASTAIISQALAVLIAFISVPLTVHYLGAERYGIWLTISSLITWMAMTDFGIGGQALVNAIAGADGKDNRLLAREYAAAAFWSLFLISTVLGVAFLAGFNHVPWKAVFRVSNAVNSAELNQACGLTLAFFVLSFPLNMLNSVYSAYQDGFVSNLWAIAGNLSALLGLLYVTQLHGGLPQLVIALCGTRLLVTATSAIYMFGHRYPWLAPWPSYVRVIRIKRLLSLGSKYMVTQLAGLSMNQSQPIMITQILGPSYVVVFVVLQRLLNIPLTLLYMALTPLIPAYSEARARDDFRWIRGALKASVLLSSAIGLVMTLVLGLSAKAIIRIWAGPAAVPASGLIVAVAVYILLAVMATPIGQVLSGLEEVAVLAVANGLCALLTLVLGIFFLKIGGLSGLGWAMAVAYLVTCLPIPLYRVVKMSRTWTIVRETEEPELQTANTA